MVGSGACGGSQRAQGVEPLVDYERAERKYTTRKGQVFLLRGYIGGWLNTTRLWTCQYKNAHAPSIAGRPRQQPAHHCVAFAASRRWRASSSRCAFRREGSELAARVSE